MKKHHCLCALLLVAMGAATAPGADALPQSAAGIVVDREHWQKPDQGGLISPLAAYAPLAAIDLDADTIITVGEKLKSYSGWPVNTRFHLENFKAALDTPGEWFLSRTGTLYYMPLPGQEYDESPGRGSRRQ